MDRSSASESLRRWSGSGRYRDPLGHLIRAGLDSHVAELDAYGFTVVPPERAAGDGFASALLEAVLDVAQRRTGIRPSPDERSTSNTAWGQHLFYLLTEGRIFEEALMNEVALALITYLLGESCVLSSMNSILKGKGEDHLILHSDTAMVPAPFPAYAQVANATWLLTNYDLEKGALCFRPGSHRLCRPPTVAESTEYDRFMPVSAPAGSLVVWHGNTWHGAFPRRCDGLRINLIMYFSRIYMQTQEWYRDRVTSEMLERNGPRFRHLVGLETPYPFGDEGAPIERIARLNSATKHQAG